MITTRNSILISYDMKILFKILVSIISCYILLQVQLRLDNHHPSNLLCVLHRWYWIVHLAATQYGKLSVHCWVRSFGRLLHSHAQLLFWLKLAWQQALWGLWPLLLNFLALTPGFFLPEVWTSCQWAVQLYDHISSHCSSLYLSQLATVNMCPEAMQAIVLPSQTQYSNPTECVGICCHSNRLLTPLYLRGTRTGMMVAWC